MSEPKVVYLCGETCFAYALSYSSTLGVPLFELAMDVLVSILIFGLFPSLLPIELCGEYSFFFLESFDFK